ncbi:MAG: hypothetical protein AAF989_14640, partial [Planctomycetota bacterium]
DRPVHVDPKAFFEPGRNDWTLQEERYTYGDEWRIACIATSETDRLAVTKNPSIDQLELAAVVFTNAGASDGVLELTATVHSDPPVEFRIVDQDGNPVEGARVKRQLKRYDGTDLPSKIQVHGLHPERAELLTFIHDELGLIGTANATLSDNPIRVVMRPAATLIGRLTHPSDEPNFDFCIRISGKAVPPDTHVAGRSSRTTETPGERRGEFRLMVSPGIAVQGDFVRKTHDRLTRPVVGKAFAPMTLSPGETRNLGNLVVP